MGYVTNNTLDSHGRILTERRVVGAVDGVGNSETTDVVTTFTYTATPSGSDPPAGLVASVTDALGNVTSLTYNNKGWLTQITDPDSHTRSFTYDAAGNALTLTDELGKVTTNTYDTLDRLLTVTLPDPDGGGALSSPVSAFVYDAVGNVTSVTDPLSRVTLLTVSAYSQPLTQRQVVGNVDGVGNSETDDVVQTIAYHTSGSNKGLVNTITDPLGNVTTIGYTSRRVTSITQPDPDGGEAMPSGARLACFQIRCVLVTSPLPPPRTARMNRSVCSEAFHRVPAGFSGSRNAASSSSFSK